MVLAHFQSHYRRRCTRNREKKSVLSVQDGHQTAAERRTPLTASGWLPPVCRVPLRFEAVVATVY